MTTLEAKLTAPRWIEAKTLEGASDPDAARQQLIIDAVKPIAANPELRARILELRRTHDRIIDDVSADALLDAYGVVDTSKAKSLVESWRSYLDEHRAEITAIQLLSEATDQRLGRRVAFGEIKELADRIARPPYNWTPDIIWNAYVALEVDFGKTPSTHRTLTDLVSLIRYTLGEDDRLVPYAEKVTEKYAAWLAQQEQAGVEFSAVERWWLDRMVQVIASSAGIIPSDLDQPPFIENGGTDGALRDLGDRTAALIDELNNELTA